MSRRKPQPKSMPQATEDLYWRAKLLVEELSSLRPIPALDQVKRAQYALEDFEASRQPTATQGQLAL